jgi:TatD DNase family protein
MVETDCPYLAPVPYRGKRCEPAHTRLVAEKIAEIRGTTVEEIAAATTSTAEKFFRLSA